MAKLRILFDEKVVCEDTLSTHMVEGEVHG